MTVRCAGVRPERLAGVLRRRERLVVGVAHRAPGGHALGRARPRAQQPAQVARRAGPSSTSKAAKCSRSCAGVAMPAWWRPWNGDRLRRAVAAGVGVGLAARARSPPPGRGGDPAARGGREQGPARQAGHRYPESALAGACESGSASASITSLSRRTWGLASAV